MGRSSNYKEQKGFFHALSVVSGSIYQDPYNSTIKSAHNIPPSEIWTETVEYAATEEDADNFVLNNPTIVTKHVLVNLKPVPYTNQQSWYLEINGEAIKSWISPTDVYDNTKKLRSIGYTAKLYTYNGEFINPGTGRWDIDYYAGIVSFDDGWTPYSLGWAQIGNGTADNPEFPIKITCYQYVGARGDFSKNQGSVAIGDAVAFLKFRNSPPLNAVDGEKYIVGNSPDGVWSDKKDYVAMWYRGSWKYLAPSEQKIYFNNEDQFWYRYYKMTTLNLSSISGSFEVDEIIMKTPIKYNDENNQISDIHKILGITYLNSNSGNIYISIVYNNPNYQIYIYSDSERTRLIAHTEEYSTPGIKNLIEDNASGIYGTITVNNIVSEDLNIYIYYQAIAIIKYIDSSSIDIQIVYGTFSSLDTIIGCSSDTTATVDSSTADNYYERIQSESYYWVDFNSGSDDNRGTHPSVPAKTVDKIINSITTQKTPSENGYIFITFLSDYDFEANPVNLQSSFWFDIVFLGSFSKVTDVTINTINSSIKSGSSWGVPPTSADQYYDVFFSTGTTEIGKPILSHNTNGENILGYIDDGINNVNRHNIAVTLNDNFIFANSNQVFSFNGDIIFDTIKINNSNINISETTYRYKNDFLILNNVLFNCTRIQSLSKIKEANNVKFIITGNNNGNIKLGEDVSNVSFYYTQNKTNNIILNNSGCDSLSIYNCDSGITTYGLCSCEDLTLKKCLKFVNMKKNSEFNVLGDLVLDKSTNNYHFTVLGSTESNVLLNGNEINNLYFNDGQTTPSFQTSKGLQYGSEYHVLENTADIKAYIPILTGYMPTDTSYYTFIINGVVDTGSNSLVPLIFPKSGKNLYKCFGKINIDIRQAGDGDLVFQIKIGENIGSAITYGTLTIPYGSDNSETNFDSYCMATAITKGHHIFLVCTNNANSRCEDITIDVEVK